MKFNTKSINKTYLIIAASFLLALPVFSVNAVCWDECASIGQQEISGNQYRVCGDYNSDYCYEWSAWQTIPPVCFDECSTIGIKQCSGAGYQTCGNYDSDSCHEWSAVTACGASTICQAGTCVADAPFCWDECSGPSAKRCSGAGYQTCGDYDSDYCYEWSSITACGAGTVCQAGICITIPPTCTNECSTLGQTTCSGTGNYLTCGNYDLDSCYEWSGPTACGAGTTCQSGICVAIPPVCSNECSTSGETTCSGTGNYLTCGNYDTDSCLEWSGPTACGSGTTCQSGVCVAQGFPTVDLRVNGSDGPINIPYNTSATLSWTSANAVSCIAQNAWVGSRPVSGSESTGNITSSKIYTLQCTNAQGSVSDSVTVNTQANQAPTANAGPDKEVLEGQSVVLEGSGTDPEAGTLTYQWTCSGGTLSANNVAQPTFTAPLVSADTNYNCTLAVTDPQSLSNSDSMNVLVRAQTVYVNLAAVPSSGSAPLSGVDLTATVSGSAIGLINYRFDCTNDGTFEHTFNNITETTRTAVDACTYDSGGTYNARVEVTRGGETAWAVATISVNSPAISVDIKANGSDGPVNVNYNGSVNLSWTSVNANSCYASGDWSGSKYTAASETAGNITSSRTYTITCTGSYGSASDSVTVYVNSTSLMVYLSVYPSSGCVSLGNVDLAASVSGGYYGDVTYYFDCTSDGSWDAVYTVNSDSYTAHNICYYTSAGTYTAKVRAQKQGFTAENIAQINVNNCYSSTSVDIKANGFDNFVSVPYNDSVNISWTSSNANYCYASGGWSGSKGTAGSESTGSLPVSRTYTITCAGSGGSASDSVTVYVGATGSSMKMTVNNLVRNLSDGTTWFDQVNAKPGDTVSFSIQVMNTNAAFTLPGVTVKDVLPGSIAFKGNLKVDNIAYYGNIISGLNIGDLSPNQSRVITFDALVGPSSSFTFGETNLINTSFASNASVSSSDTSTVLVKKSGVLGAATGVSTGITNNIFLDSFLIPLLITLLIIWASKAQIFDIENWVSSRQRNYRERQAKKLLLDKIAEAKGIPDKKYNY